MASRSLTRAEELYHAALARPPTERAAYLDEVCGGDEALRSEVRSLLAFQADAARLLNEPVAEAATQRLAVAAGTRLGSYEILELVGAGGMGEVHRARDTRLGREVAIKLLPQELADDPALLASLEREARALASLDHPGIAAIHGLEEQGGVRFLVLELVPGRTLAERLRRGPLPLREALGLGAQIAAALSAAHERGLIHRDLKPSNVNVTPEGRAKLLDFGLARAWARPGEGAGDDDGTGATPLTETGVVHGTAPYMSPEQARGEELDPRSDIWSFGCVLFEMLTGHRAFPADTASESIAAVLEHEPGWARLPDETPPNVRSLLEHCLRKDRTRRLRDAADARIELEDALAVPDAAGVPSGGGAPVRERPSRAAWVWRAVVVAALVVLAGAWWWSRAPRVDRAGPVVRSHIDLEPERQIPATCGRRCPPPRTELALSPDGNLLAWTGNADGDYFQQERALHLRKLDTGQVARLPGTEAAHSPFFSPDGRWIGFIALEDGSWFIRKVPVEGGLPVELAEITEVPDAQNELCGMGASWGPDGRIFLGLGGIHAVPDTGGALAPITTPDLSREVGHRLPFALPGGHALLFTAMPHSWGLRARVEAVSLPDGERRLVVDDAADARYLPTGHLVFVRRGTLMAAPFDPERLELTAAPVQVVRGVLQALNGSGDMVNSGAGQYAVSRSGLLVYAAGGVAVDRPADLVLVDERGRVEPLPGFDKPLVSAQLHLSPDGRRLAFVERAASGLAWVFDLERQTYRALTTSGIASSPAFSPDGTRLAMTWSEGGPLQLWTFALQGGDREQLTEGGSGKFSPAWSPDGRHVAFRSDGDIHLYDLDEGRVAPLVAGDGRQMYPEFSPDGRWLAYASDETGQQQIYLKSFPEREVTLTVSSRGGSGPIWSRDGSRLYFVSPREGRARSMMAVDVGTGSPPPLGRPQELFRLPEEFRTQSLRFYQRLPDGRFLVAVWGAAAPIPPITRLELVHNWFAELERLSPKEPTL